MTGKSGTKRKKSKNSPGVQAEPPENKRTMAAYASPTTVNVPSQQQASHFSQYSPAQLMQSQYGLPTNLNAMFHAPQPMTPGNSANRLEPDEQVLNKILCRLDAMDRKLSQLDSIQSSVNSMVVRMDSVEAKVKKLETVVDSLESSRNFDSGSIDRLNEKQQEIDALTVKMKQLENERRNQVANDNMIKAELMDIKCRSMRDNLLFFGIEEERNETDEECVTKVLNLIEDTMKIENGKEMKLHRAHRIGRYNSAKVRPIVAKFAYYPDRERVRSSYATLNGTHYRVSQQFPKEVMDTRRRLGPILKQARDDGKEAYMVRDKLYINRELYRESVA